MGGGNIEIDPARIAALQNASISDIQPLANDVISYFEKLENSSKFPHVRSLLELVSNAIQIASTSLSNLDSSEKVGIDYHQAQESLKALKPMLAVYVKDPKDENFKKISESCGHIMDRVSQKLLSTLGRDEVKNFYKALSEEQNKLRLVYESLSQSAIALQAFSNQQIDSALHYQFSNELSKVEKASQLWFWMAAIITGLQLIITCYAVGTFPDFLKSLEIPTDSGGIFLILASSPRILLSAVLLVAAFSSWKIFHTYKHLEVGIKRKQSAAKLIPTLMLGLDQKVQSEIKQAFLLKILEQEETGFIAQAKSSTYPIFDNIKGGD